MDREEKALNLLGLARRAGRLVLGSDAVELALQGTDIAAIILADDLASGPGSKFERLAREKGVEVFRFASKKDLGHVLGRRDVGVIGLLDSGLARAIARTLGGVGKEGE